MPEAIDMILGLRALDSREEVCLFPGLGAGVGEA